MARSPFNLVIGIWLLQAVTFSNSVHALAQSTCRAIETSSSSKNAPLLPLFRYKNGLVDVNIDKAPLGTILYQLKAEFDIKVKLYDPSMACSPVSIVLKGRPLEYAIKDIMKRISYVLYPIGNSFKVIVLTDDKFSIKAHGSISYETEPTAHPTSLNSHNATQIPKSLDEFQPIKVEVQENTDPSKQVKAIQKYQKALIQRALAAINSQYEHLHKEATSQLIGINDPLATEILIEATSTEKDSISRGESVEALRQHVENLQYNDATSIEALERLAEDSDLNISNIARQALQEKDKLQTENQNQNYELP